MSIRCRCCGGSEFKKIGSIYVCIFCGSKYQAADLGLKEETANERKSDIRLADDIERLKKLAQSDPKNRRRYLNLILEMDPNNAFARAGLRGMR